MKVVRTDHRIKMWTGGTAESLAKAVAQVPPAATLRDLMEEGTMWILIFEEEQAQ